VGARMVAHQVHATLPIDLSLHQIDFLIDGLV
jgi:hypothetical protein